MPLRIVIVGGVGAGAGAATRARRLDEQAEIILFERSGYVSFANCGLPYYLGNIIADRGKLLVQSPEMFRKRFRIDVRVRHEVTAIDRSGKRVQVSDLNAGTSRWEPYDRLILCPGACPIVPPIEGADATNVFTLRNMEDTDAIYGCLAKQDAHTAAIVGAGFIGLEVADALTRRGIRVQLVERLGQVLAPLDADMTGPIERHLREKGVTPHLGNGLKALTVENGRATHVGLDDGTRIEADMVLLAIGVRPETRLAADTGLALGPRGGIRVDEFLRTSDPDIFAAGDAVEVVHAVTGVPALIPLAGPANKHGRLAGEIAVTGRPRRAARVVGTAIVKVFDLAAGLTGLSVKAAAQAGIETRHCIVQRPNHATYYPGATMMTIKIVYRPADRRLLGVQIVGRDGVDRRLDVAATVLHFGGTIDDLADLDLAYAPQFGSAKDPLNIAAFVAQNQEDGLGRHVDPAEVERLRAEGWQLVDLRTAAEYAGGTIPGAVNIALDELRSSASQIAGDRPVLVFCQVGQRGYVGARILQNLGRTDVVNLAGGYSWYASQKR